MPFALYAQDRIVTPFTPRVVQPDGTKVYVKTQPNSGRFGLSVGYGFMPASSFNSTANQYLIYTNPGDGKRSDGNITSSMGAVHFAFNYEINPWLELSIPIVYSRNWGTQNFPVRIDGVQHTKSGYLRDNWFSLIPSVRVNWMRNSWLSLYSRAGVGISLANRNRGIDNDLYSSPAFAWQFSPVGIEMGRKVCFYLEAGYGFTGVINGGVKFKIGKVLEDGSISTGRKVEWYEKYMH